jgi:exonuclease III
MANQNITNSKEPIGFLSLNANGLRNDSKRKSLIRWLKIHHQAENKIVFLQETHTNSANEKSWKNDWTGDVIFSHGTNDSKGAAILLPKDTEYLEENIHRDPDGRYIVMTINVNNSEICLANAYAPTGDNIPEQIQWLNNLQNILDEYSHLNFIIGGDINTPLNPILDKYNAPPNSQPSDYARAWTALFDDLNLTDIWRTLNPFKKRYTWRQGGRNSPLKQSRLDYWIISIPIIFDLNTVEISPGFRSDHSLIEINFNQAIDDARGPSFWRFNSNLIKDENYVEKVKETIQKSRENHGNIEDKGLIWDLIKMDIRSITISFSKNKARENRDLIKDKMSQFATLENILGQKTEVENQENHIKYEALKLDIENYNNEKSRGAQLRSKAEWAEFGERNSKFFLNLEKRRYKAKCITTLIDENENEINKAEEILEYEKTFYKKLYTETIDPNAEETNIAATHFLGGGDIPHISDENKQNCDMEINIIEIGQALKELQNGKSPGSDGLTPDFYKFFWPQIKGDVFNSLTYAATNKHLSIDQRRGVINLIPKKEKDPRLIKNWRPISLLNTDYKIITKLLATRIKKVLPTVIHADQVAYLKDRFIGQNIRSILDIMDYTKLEDKNGIIAFLDFEKAFDTIRWSVIEDSLKAFNFGDNIRQWVQTIYNNNMACVTNNGFSSEFFKLSRGVRQGCPLSPYLFLVVVELVSIKIRNNDNIKGIKIDDTELKILQMADDTTVFVEDINSLKLILGTIFIFQQYAGLKLNKNKTEAMWIGSQRNSDRKPLELKWVKEVHALGITFSYDTDVMNLKNLIGKIKSFKQILNMWSQRDLSLIGKITILKTLAFSKIIYPCGMLYTPKYVVDQLTKIAYTYIWCSKPEKIKRNTLIADYKDGGLKMLDIESFVKAQKAMWVKRLTDPQNGSWKTYPLKQLNKLVGKNTFKCSLSKQDIAKANLTEFYKQVLESWTEIRNITLKNITPQNIRNECLWLNHNICMRKQSLNWKNWQTKGVYLISDIVHEDGTFITPNELSTKMGHPCNFMQFNSLKDSIPKLWRTSLKEQNEANTPMPYNEPPHLIVKNKIKCIQKIQNKDLYWILVENKQCQPIIKDKWTVKLGINISEKDWTNIFTIPKVVKDTKLRAFQYKVLFNLIICKSYLHKIGKAPNDKCDKCNKPDHLIHFFFECDETKNFWINFSTWWENITHEHINVTKKEAIVGFLDAPDSLNACILFAKWFIYREKINNRNTFFFKFQYELKYRLAAEKIIAINNNKLEKYTTIWRAFEIHLDNI